MYSTDMEKLMNGSYRMSHFGRCNPTHGKWDVCLLTACQ